jgi:hypothetical protein
MEYNNTNDEPDNELDHYANTLQWSNEDCDPGINDMFLNNLDPTFYTMQMQNPGINTRTNEKKGRCEQIHRCTKTRNRTISGHKHFGIYPQNQITS